MGIEAMGRNMERKTMWTRSLCLMVGVMSLAASARAEGPAPQPVPQQEHYCSAQCVSVSEAGYVIDYGYPARGWSTYSLGEAYEDLLAHCPAPRVLVHAVEQRRWHRYHPGHWYWHWAGHENELRLYFAEPARACVSSVVNPNGGRRYVGGRPIGG